MSLSRACDERADPPYPHQSDIAATVRRDVRRPRVVASMALIAVLAAVAVPGSVGSRGPSPETVIDPNLFRPVEVSSTRGTAMTIPALDPAYRSNGALDKTSVLLDPDQRLAPAGRPDTSTD